MLKSKVAVKARDRFKAELKTNADAEAVYVKNGKAHKNIISSDGSAIKTNAADALNRKP